MKNPSSLNNYIYKARIANAR